MDLANDYRPESFDNVIGQAAVVRSLEKFIKNGKVPHAFLFSGSSGTGKTTVARIIANDLGCKGMDLVEIDAATHSGIDAIRQITSRAQYTNINGRAQVTIIDECHALSKQAFQALLKPIEDSKEGFYWILCTTDIAKVPATIKTRCHAYVFNDVDTDDLEDLIKKVASDETIKIKGEVIDLIAKAAMGSPRQALTFLSMVSNCKNVKEAQKLLRDGSYQTKDAIDLCRALVGHGNGARGFDDCIELVKKMRESYTAEGIRIMIQCYCASCFMGKNMPKKPGTLLAVMEAFSESYNQSEKMAPLILSLGSLFFDE